MCQVNEGWSFSATWGSETPEPIHLKSGMCDYVHSPTNTQNMMATGNGGEVVPLRAFYLFLVPSMRPQLTLRSVDFRSAHPKTCFSGGCVPLGRFAQWVNSFFFCPKKNIFFQWAE